MKNIYINSSKYLIDEEAEVTIINPSKVEMVKHIFGNNKINTVFKSKFCYIFIADKALNERLETELKNATKEEYEKIKELSEENYKKSDFLYQAKKSLEYIKLFCVDGTKELIEQVKEDIKSKELELEKIRLKEIKTREDIDKIKVSVINDFDISSKDETFLVLENSITKVFNLIADERTITKETMFKINDMLKNEKEFVGSIIIDSEYEKFKLEELNNLESEHFTVFFEINEDENERFSIGLCFSDNAFEMLDIQHGGYLFD